MTGQFSVKIKLMVFIRIAWLRNNKKKYAIFIIKYASYLSYCWYLHYQHSGLYCVYILVRHWSTEQTKHWFVVSYIRTILIWINPFRNEFYSALMYVQFPDCIACADLNGFESRPSLYFPGYNFWDVYFWHATFRLMAENVFAPPSRISQTNHI